MHVILPYGSTFAFSENSSWVGDLKKNLANIIYKHMILTKYFIQGSDL